jgi:hypothetical protein
MIKIYNVGSTVPSLRGIIELLRGLPDEYVTLLQQLKPPLEWKTAEEWLEGWRVLNRHDIYQSELARLLMTSSKKIPDDFSLDQLTTEKLHEIVDHFLFVGASRRDEKRREQLDALLRKAPDDERLASALVSALTNSLQNETNSETFERRFAGPSPALKRLFERLAPDLQQKLVALFARKNKERFQDEAYELYKYIVETQPTLALQPYERAVLQYLRSALGANLKDQIGTWYYTFLDADAIDEQLDNLLNDPPGEALAEDYAQDIQNAPKQSLMSRLATFFGFRSAADTSLTIVPADAPSAEEKKTEETDSAGEEKQQTATAVTADEKPHQDKESYDDSDYLIVEVEVDQRRDKTR